MFIQHYRFCIDHGKATPGEARKHMTRAAWDGQQWGHRNFRFGTFDDAPVGRLFVRSTDKVTNTVGGIEVTVEMNLPYFDGERGIAASQAEGIAQDICQHLDGHSLYRQGGDDYDDR